MVITSGIVTSRASFSLASPAACPLRRCTRRRNAATERSRSSSADNAVTTVRRPRRFSPVVRTGFGAGAGRATPPRRTVRGASSSSASTTTCGRACGAGFGFLLAEPLLGLLFGLALGLVVVAATLLLLALARFGSFPFLLLAALALGAAPCLFFGDLALFGLAHAGIRQRVGARRALLLGERSQNHAGGLGCRPRRPCPGAAAPCRGRRRCRRRGLGLRFGFARPDHAPLHLLHHDRLGAAMAEALAHHTLLDAALRQRQGLGGGDLQRLVAGIFRFGFRHYRSSSTPRRL